MHRRAGSRSSAATGSSRYTNEEDLGDPSYQGYGDNSVEAGPPSSARNGSASGKSTKVKVKKKTTKSKSSAQTSAERASDDGQRDSWGQQVGEQGPGMQQSLVSGMASLSVDSFQGQDSQQYGNQQYASQYAANGYPHSQSHPNADEYGNHYSRSSSAPANEPLDQNPQLSPTDSNATAPSHRRRASNMTAGSNGPSHSSRPSSRSSRHSAGKETSPEHHDAGSQMWSEGDATAPKAKAGGAAPPRMQGLPEGGIKMKNGRQVVKCEWCSQMLAAPAKLEPNRDGVQKLRCGKCLKVSKFAVVASGAGGPSTLVPLSATATATSATGASPEAQARGAQQQPPQQQFQAQQQMPLAQQQAMQQHAPHGPQQGFAPQQPMAAAPGWSQTPQGQWVQAPAAAAGAGGPAGRGDMAGGGFYGGGYAGQDDSAPGESGSLSGRFSQSEYGGPAPAGAYGAQAGVQGQMAAGQGQAGYGYDAASAGDPSSVAQGQEGAYGGAGQWGTPYAGGSSRSYGDAPAPGGYGQGYGEAAGQQALPPQQWAQQAQWQQQQQQQWQHQPSPQYGQMPYGQQPMYGGTPMQAPGWQGAQGQSPMGRPGPGAGAMMQAGGGMAGMGPMNPVMARSASKVGPSGYAAFDDGAGGKGAQYGAGGGLTRTGSTAARRSAMADGGGRGQQGGVRRITSTTGQQRGVSFEGYGPPERDREGGFRRVLTERGSRYADEAEEGRPMPRSMTSGGTYRRKVFVNGTAIPDALVAAVEDRIGKIETGKYWYDFRAGFWGPMGSHAFGVILSGIPEFAETRMSRDCSGGGTRIVVNGRELAKKDLVFLGKKGLLELPGANYTLEADGAVVDNTSGKTMRPLGKLTDLNKKNTEGMYAQEPVKSGWMG